MTEAINTIRNSCSRRKGRRFRHDRCRARQLLLCESWKTLLYQMRVPNTPGECESAVPAVDFCDDFCKGRTASPISKMLSSTTHTPTGRLAMPKTRRVDVLSTPNTLTSNSDAASATFGCSRNSGV